MICTIGSNGKKLPQFIEMIQGIDTVMDVRFLAKSHWVKEFSDESLSVELPAIGINYIHKPEFGVPPNIVNSYTKLKTLTDEEFETYYRESNKIDKLEIEGKTVLLCACAYATKQGKQKWNCHRSILAKMLVETGKYKGIIHL
jgi:uncharacterized protein (DUF488 family)